MSLSLGAKPGVRILGVQKAESSEEPGGGPGLLRRNPPEAGDPCDARRRRRLLKESGVLNPGSLHPEGAPLVPGRLLRCPERPKSEYFGC